MVQWDGFLGVWFSGPMAMGALARLLIVTQMGSWGAASGLRPSGVCPRQQGKDYHSLGQGLLPECDDLRVTHAPCYLSIVALK